MALTLRAVVPSDLPSLTRAQAAWGDRFEFFGFAPSNGYERWYAETGCLSDDNGMLVVDLDGSVAGQVHWWAVEYGPGVSNRAMRMGIALVPEERGKGYGAQAQRMLAEYLFATTVVERIEAGTDISNLPEQRALEKAGFRRDGVLRGAQYRDGTWHDLAFYSRLRSDD
jgi:RimJ/RimL family protein N-acetyltransferase